LINIFVFFLSESRGATPPRNRRNILKRWGKVTRKREKGTYNRPNQRLGNEKGLSRERNNRKDYRG
jgi:hypothetical protein